MRLLHEYIERHKLVIPEIYHVRNTNLILRLHTRPQVVLNIEWQEIQNRPGYYTFKYLTPNHNGYMDGNYFVSLDEDHIYHYNEYVDFVNRWTRNLEFTPVKENDVPLAIWEMFLFCFDGWLSENNLEEAIFYEDFEDHILKYDPLVHEIYLTEFKKLEIKYAEWLVNLINFYKTGGCDENKH